MKIIFVITFKPHNVHIHLCFFSKLKEIRTIFKCSGGSFSKGQKLKSDVIDKILFRVIEKYKIFINKNIVIQNTQIFFIYQGFNTTRFIILKKILQSNLPIYKFLFVQKKAFNGCRKKRKASLIFRASV